MLDVLVLVLGVGRMAVMSVTIRTMERTLRIQLNSTVVASTFMELDTLLIVLLELIQFYHRELLLQRAGSLLLLSKALLLLHVGVPTLIILLLKQSLIMLCYLPLVLRRRFCQSR